MIELGGLPSDIGRHKKKEQQCNAIQSMTGAFQLGFKFPVDYIIA